MELIKELDPRRVVSKTGKVRAELFGLFLCKFCNNEIESTLVSGSKAKSCSACRGLARSAAISKKKGFNGFKLIEELGAIETGGIDTRNGTKHRAVYGLFECPICNSRVKLPYFKTRINTGCINCRADRSRSHGMSSARQYQIWQGMKDRCNRPGNVKYHLYGGKGIKVCDRWNEFEGFWEDMKDGYTDDMTIDRKDSDKDYCPENCRWLTSKENSSKTSKRRPVEQYEIREETKEYLVKMATYESILNASKICNIHPMSIQSVLGGKSKTAGGYGWRYKNSTGDLD